MGAKIAEFLDNVVKFTNSRASDIHLIGHSLGAHVSGSIGSNFKSGKIGRITGKHNRYTNYSNNVYTKIILMYIL